MSTHTVHDPASRTGSLVEAFYALQDADALFRSRLRDHLRLGANDLGAVQLLARREELGRSVRPRDISESLGVTGAGTTILLTRLVKLGLVTRHADPDDGRGQLVRLTQVAHSRMAEAIGESRSGLHDHLGRVTAREAKAMLLMLAAVTGSLDLGVVSAAALRR